MATDRRVPDSLIVTPEQTRSDVRRVLWITLVLNVVVSVAKIMVCQAALPSRQEE